MTKKQHPAIWNDIVQWKRKNNYALLPVKAVIWPSNYFPPKSLNRQPKIPPELDEDITGKRYAAIDADYSFDEKKEEEG